MTIAHSLISLVKKINSIYEAGEEKIRSLKNKVYTVGFLFSLIPGVIFYQYLKIGNEDLFLVTAVSLLGATIAITISSLIINSYFIKNDIDLLSKYVQADGIEQAERDLENFIQIPENEKQIIILLNKISNHADNNGLELSLDIIEKIKILFMNKDYVLAAEYLTDYFVDIESFYKDKEEETHQRNIMKNKLLEYEKQLGIINNNMSHEKVKYANML